MPDDRRGQPDPAVPAAPLASETPSGGSLFGDPGSRTVDPPSLPPYSENASPADPSPAHTPGPGDATVVTPGADRRHLPERIGRYRIKRMIGFGGMGTVYEAIQESPRRTVALKVMKPGIASRSALKRFEYESQLLARLRHPGIAQVYDAGTHDEGAGPVPFFAMEYIPGAQSITDYAKAKSLSTRQRMQLFVRVCDAVHHGHQKGVIHRDLKPANILIDNSGNEALGQPKVIDFGVARTTDADIAVTTMQTDVGQLIGTLQYMSPEQCAADAGDIDTRSDVYALGVILYELLSGRLPYDVTGVAVYDATRIVRDNIPARLTTINAQLGGDIETIVLKALEKDRERRYQSAAELARDINRYLSSEPISARRASIPYLIKVFTKRHKPVVAAVLGIFAALVLAIVGVSMALVKANRQAGLAQTALATAATETAQARATVGFLASLLQSVDPLGQRFASAENSDELLSAALLGKPGREITVAELLREASQNLDTIFEGKPLLEAEVRDILGTTFHGMGLFAEAQSQLRRAYELRRRELGEDAPDTLRTMVNLANTLRGSGQLAEAERYFRAGAEGLTKALGPRHPDALYARSWVSVYDRRGAAAELRNLLQVSGEVFGPSHPRTVGVAGVLASTLINEGNAAEGEAIARAYLEKAQAAFGQTRFQTALCTFLVGHALREQGKVEESVSFLRRALELYRRFLGTTHPLSATVASMLALSLSETGRHDEAANLARELDQAFPSAHEPATITLRQTIARIYLAAGATERALAIFSELHAAARLLAPIDDGVIAALNLDRGVALKRLQRFEDADRALEEAYQYYAAAGARQRPAAVATLQALLRLHEASGQTERLERARARLQQLEAASR